jgi:small nuclear ribonucleoprotein (snRNP)-like protein
MEESIEKGLTVIEDVRLDEDQMNLIISNSVKLRSASGLQSLYNSWKEKIHSPEMAYFSNIRPYIETEEGQRLIDYAKNHLKESITFFANVVFANEEATFEKYIAEYLFCEITRENYAFILEEIKDEWKRKNYDDQGRYIAPMPETFAKKYIKRLLDKVVLKEGETSNAVITAVDSHSVINISPNPADDYAAIHIDLPQKATVSVRIFNQASHLIATVLNGRILENGKHSFSLDADSLSKGLYVCVVEINGKLYSRKLLKR